MTLEERRAWMRAGCPVEAPSSAPGRPRVAIWVVGAEDGEAASTWRVSRGLSMSGVARDLFVGMQRWPDMTDPAAGRVEPVRREHGATMHMERACVVSTAEACFGRDVAEDVRHVLWAGLPGTRADAFDALGRLLDLGGTVARKPSLGRDPATATEAPSGRTVEVHWTTVGPATGADWGSFWQASRLGDEA